MDESSGFNFQPVIDLATDAKDAMADFAGDILPILGAIAASVLVIWLARWAFRKVRQWMSAS